MIKTDEQFVSESLELAKLDAVKQALVVAREHELETEVMTFALDKLAKGSCKKVIDALNHALGEWIK